MADERIRKAERAGDEGRTMAERCRVGQHAWKVVECMPRLGVASRTGFYVMSGDPLSPILGEVHGKACAWCGVVELYWPAPGRRG